ncbi:MAG: FkbM family methyltransferase [Clostridia bacterium]|nr:FkbM family methyltransferase [Clostridia bacterium]
MPYLHTSLPEYPIKRDMWDALAEETRPILVYGMGNGADKLFSRFEKYSITVSDIFASDGFVRGHSYRGMRVKSFSEVREEYEDFVIVLSFASSRPEVLEMLKDMNEKYDLYVPDMPVADEGEFFDREFFNTHYGEILEAYNRLADSDSKNAFSSIINYKISGKMKYLEGAYCTKEEMYSLMPLEDIRSIIDVGAYNGDTLREALEFFPRLERAIAIEPDPKNYKRLAKYLEGERRIAVRAENACALDVPCEVAFSVSGNRNSTATATASHESRSINIPAITLDSLEADVDYIKYDVEGAEARALLGSRKTIERCHPILLVSLYHRSRDIFELINTLSAYGGYEMRLCRLRCLPAWEINMIMLPTKE